MAAVVLATVACTVAASRAEALPANLDQIRAAAAAQDDAAIAPADGREAGSPAQRSAAADSIVARDLPELELRPDPGPTTIGGPGARLDRAQSSLARQLGPLGIFAVDRVTGTPRFVATLDGALTAPSDADPAEVALDYVGGQEQAFGLDDAALGKLELDSRYTTVTGLTTMHWTQSYHGVELVDSGLAANVDDRGRLINVSGSPTADPEIASTTPGFGAERALGIAADDAGVDAAAVESGPAGPNSETAFADGSGARLMIYTLGSGLRLAWQVDLDADSQHYYEYEIDATSGELLARHNLVASENARTYDLWPNAQNFGPFHGGVAQLRPLQRLSGNDPWRYDTQAPPYNLGFQTLGGNQAFLVLDIDDNDGQSGLFVQPSDASNNWDYPQTYTNPGPPVKCPPGGLCTWNPAGQFQNFLVNGAQGGVQAYWYTNEMHDHLMAPPIGFTEASGNFELVNQDGNGGLANDDVFLQGLDGANTSVGYPDADHLNNANMLTLKDGVSPVMQMYLFSQFPPGAPGPQGDPAFEVYGGDDAAVLMHEYVHGLSNRLVGGPNSQGDLQAPQAGAMGEAWSDWYAQDYLVDEGRLFDNRNTPGEMVQGKYEGFTIVRTQGLDCKVGVVVPTCMAPQGSPAGNGGYTYGDFGRIHGKPEVHDDGEIWGQTLWDLRDGLIAKHGVADGVRRAEQLITDGLRLAPIQPTFLDARNAILNANTAGHLADEDVIWSVFAKRGMGSNANTSGPGDVHPSEGFTNPLGGGNAACQEAIRNLEQAQKKVSKARAAVRKASGKKKAKAKRALKRAKRKAQAAKQVKQSVC